MPGRLPEAGRQSHLHEGVGCLSIEAGQDFDRQTASLGSAPACGLHHAAKTSADEHRPARGEHAPHRAGGFEGRVVDALTPADHCDVRSRGAQRAQRNGFMPLP